MIIVTREVLAELCASHPVKRVKKTGITMARLFTKADKDACFVSPQRASETPIPGHIWTREGIVSFDIKADILCRGVDGELWPMPIEEFLKIKERTSPDDEEGWASYTNKNINQAIIMHKPFATIRPNGEQVTGEAGDWLIFNEKSIWPVGSQIFTDSYDILI